MLDTAGCNSAPRPTPSEAHPPQALNTGGVEPFVADPIRDAIEATAALLAPFAISWVEPQSRDDVRVSFRDETGCHTAVVDFGGDDPEIYGVHAGLHGIESSYELSLDGDRWHEVLSAAEVVRDGGKWIEPPSLDAVNAEIVVAHAEVML